jgi:heptosyltransferase-2
MDIAVIKLGAQGDVVRTLPLAEAIKKKHPEAKITWITREIAFEFFEGNPFVDKVEAIPYSSDKKFDVLYNFDIDEEATKLAADIKAGKKYGFYSEGGYASAFNIGAEYYLNTLFDDELKKSNKKTYQEMMFETAELPYSKEKGTIFLDEKEKSYGKDFIKENGLEGKKIIGIHMGSSPRWPSKAWDIEKIKEFVTKAKGYEILLFGGPDEIEKHGKLIKELEEESIKVWKNNPRNTLREFFSLVNICDKMVCSDSLAIHVSLALKKPTMGLFFCTSPHEVEGYDLLRKIVSPMLYEFFPEKMDQYSRELVNSISVEQVLKSIID